MRCGGRWLPIPYVADADSLKAAADQRELLIETQSGSINAFMDTNVAKTAHDAKPGQEIISYPGNVVRNPVSVADLKSRADKSRATRIRNKEKLAAQTVLETSSSLAERQKGFTKKMANELLTKYPKVKQKNFHV